MARESDEVQQGLTTSAARRKQKAGADDPGSPQKRKKYCHSEPQAKNLRTKKLVRSEILRHGVPQDAREKEAPKDGKRVG